MLVPFNSLKSLVCSYFDGTLSPDAQLQNETFQNTKRQRKARVKPPACRTWLRHCLTGLVANQRLSWLPTQQQRKKETSKPSMAL